MYKKIIGLSIFLGILLLFTQMSFAQYNLLNYISQIFSHRESVTSDDTSDPTTTTDAVNIPGYSHAKICWFMNGDTSSFDITPELWDSSINGYILGEPIHVMNESSGAVGESSGAFNMPIDQSPYIYTKINNIIGASPLINIYIQGVNRL